MWIAAKETANDQRLRRRIFALVMPSLPTPMLLSLNTLKRLGLLPKDWPLCKQINLSEEDQKALDEIELSPLTEPEEELNTCLHAEHGANHLDHDVDEDDTLAPGEEDPLARYELPSSLFDETSVDMIPGYATRLSPRVKALLDKYKSVFQKSLSANMHTRFPPVEFTLRDNFKPPPRARTALARHL